MGNAENPEDDCTENERPQGDIQVTWKTPSFSLLSDRDTLEDEDAESDWREIDLGSFLG
jgi:hypothetical protein